MKRKRIPFLILLPLILVKNCCAFFHTKTHLGLPKRPLAVTSSSSSFLKSHRELTEIQSDAKQEEFISAFPRGDDLDVKIFSLALPAMLNLVIIPLTSAVDMYYIGKMNNALAIAGSAAACQVYNSIFWVLSFLPLLVSPLVARSHAKGDTDATTEHITESLVIAGIIGVVGNVFFTMMRSSLLNIVLPVGAASRSYAEPYLLCRITSFIPAILSAVCFSSFRGMMDVMTPLRISFITNLINAILDPIMMFRLGMGVAGAAAASCIADLVGFLMYIFIMIKRKMIKLEIPKLPRFSTIKEYLRGAIGIQSRAICIELTFVMVTRATQLLDPTGVASAAHAISMQLWAVAGILNFAMNGVAAIMIPSNLAKSKMNYSETKTIAKRLFSWGLVFGVILATLQLGSLSVIKMFTSLEEVQKAAKNPTIIAAFLQLINGITFIGEGIQQGSSDFSTLAKTAFLATISMFFCLKTAGKNSLTGIWLSLGVFYIIRCLGTMKYFFVSGPFAKSRRSTESPVNPEDEGIDGRPTNGMMDAFSR